MSENGATKSLAEFAAQLEFENIPENILKYLKLLFLDGVGCCIHGNTLEWSKTLREVVTNKEDITIETSASGTDETISVDSNVVSTVISTEDAIKEKNNINRFTTPEDVINNFKNKVMANPQWNKSSPEIKSEVIKNILEDYPEMSEVLSSQFLELLIVDVKKPTKKSVDDTEVNMLLKPSQTSSLLDLQDETYNEGIRKISEDSFKLGEFFKEKEKETAIKKAEKYLSGESSVFMSSTFNKWAEQTKGIKSYKIKKEDKPELVKEFVEFLQNN